MKGLAFGVEPITVARPRRILTDFLLRNIKIQFG